MCWLFKKKYKYPHSQMLPVDVTSYLVIKQINTMREYIGLPELKVDDQCLRAADERALYCVTHGTLTHNKEDSTRREMKAEKVEFLLHFPKKSWWDNNVYVGFILGDLKYIGARTLRDIRGHTYTVVVLAR